MHIYDQKAYDIPTFCKLHSIGKTTAYSEISLGRLKSITVGRRRLIPAASAEEWLQTLQKENPRLYANKASTQGKDITC